jgi:flagellar biosynthesis GTPase FlhF
MVKTTYTLDEFIRDIAFSSYGTTFIEVLTDYLTEERKFQGGRAQYEVDPIYLQSLNDLIPTLKFRLGTTNKQLEEARKSLREIEKARKTFFQTKTKPTKKELEEAINKFNEEMKKQSLQNYKVYPIDSAFTNYRTLIEELRNQDQKVFELNVYNITDSLRKKFLTGSGLKNLSKVVSPDWTYPLADEKKQDELDKTKFWTYIPDQNIRLQPYKIPFKGYRGGYKLIVVPKNEVQKILDSEDLKNTVIATKKIHDIDINNDAAFQQWKKDYLSKFKNNVDKTQNASFSENHGVYIIKYPNNALTITDFLDYNTHFFNFNNCCRPLDLIKLSDIKDVAPFDIKEPFKNLFDDIEDFINDYNRFKVKQTTENVNLIIPEKLDKGNVSRQLGLSASFTKDMMKKQLNLIRLRLRDEFSTPKIKEFDKLMEKLLD